ncbi:amino acid adenylation domain-containing protein [Mycetohabitans sp. B8]|uniref:non-ribosomal peptide synthetase n=1 Tax=Mycetohabitans sp. B8 TaxID=2841845 RepID=UPI001F30187E|nr:non-ribosomal peptide synthetase [Mycetohabitans sp. B8]MCG1042450.1 amino acid adenylation domain-containing protein [Mycetohabitans sp. B8]
MDASVTPVTYALSTAQTEVWLAQQLHPDSPVYNLAQYTVIEGAIDPDAFKAALRQVIDEADTLRLQFIDSDDGLRQRIGSPAWSVPVLDLTTEADPQAAAQAWMRADYQQPVNLMQGPLFCYALLKVAPAQWIWYQRTHAIIIDRYTFFLIAQRVAQVYSAMCEGIEPDPCTFGSVLKFLESEAQYQNSAQLARDEAYWLKQCADWPQPATLASHSVPASRHRLRQTTYLTTQAVEGYASNANQLGQLLSAALAAYLYRMTGAQDVVLGLPVTADPSADRPIPGTLANRVPLRFTLEPDMNLSSLMQQAAQQIQHGCPYQRYPNKALRRQFGPTVNVMPFDYGLSFGKHTAKHHPLLNGPVEDLMLDAYWTPASHQLRIGFHANPTLYNEDELTIHQRRFIQFLEALAVEPTRSISDIDLLDAVERHRLLVEWNATERDYPSGLGIHQLFEAQVARTPDAVALVHEGQALTYATLNAWANRLAHRLIELGVKPDTRVAVCMERSPAMVIGLLAILKAGGAYVPLDPAYPAERLAYMLEDSVPQAVLVQAVTRDLIGKRPVPVIDLDASAERDYPEHDPRVPSLTPHHPAYVVYTSGSTGQPKGVEATVEGLANRLLWFALDVLKEPPVTALKTSIGFVDSVTEVLGTLLAGGSLIVFDNATFKDASLFARRLRQTGVSHLIVVPSLLKYLLENENDQLDRLQVIICSGERLAPELARRVAALRPDIRLLNFYGSSEVNGDVTFYEYGSVDQIPPQTVIGRPIANTQIYILDRYSRPVPPGVAGEIHVGGVSVARGYLNRPELTAERFVVNPFQNGAQGRMYKTGDLGRWLADGNIEYLGRDDHQVKIRGFRIELGEIEAQLARHPLVRNAAVLACGEGNDRRLVAYVEAEPAEQLAGTLRAQVAAALPDYMVPAAFVRLDAFPLTANGKLDRRALPEPDADAFVHQAYEAPQGELETTLAAIWAELLGVERVGRHDSFFALGGHSLLAVQLMERLRRQGLSVSVRALFDTPVLSALAQQVGQHREVVVPANAITPDTTAITPAMLPLIDLTQADIDRIVEQVPQGVANIQDIYALSPLQDGILFHHLLATEGDPYLLTAQLAFDSRARLDQYLEAVQQVIHRHDILRTAFVWQGLSTPAQVVWRRARLSVTELTLDPADGPIAEQLAQRLDPRRYRVDLTQAPLLRCAVAQDTDGRWLLVELLHHLIGDRTTWEVMHTEVQAFIEGRGDALPPAQPFRHLVAQARLGVSEAEHERFFTGMLADIDEPTLPFGLTDVHRDGRDVTESHRKLPPALNDQLRAHAKRLGVSLASLCHLAWAQVLARASGQPRVVFGTVLFGRMHAGDGAHSAMGLFINTLPLCVDLDGSVQDSVRHTHARLAALLEHEHASLTLAQRCSGVPAGTPLFNALLNYRHNAMDSSGHSGLPGVELLSAQERTNYPLILSVEDDGQTLGLTAQSVSSLEPERVCAYMQQALQSLADVLEAAPDTAVQQLQVLPDAERQLLLDTWNATQQDYPSHLCIHQLFEAQVARTPEATALVYEDQTLSYAQLNARANRLAHRLIELGVQPDVRVALCVERSPALVVGLLAILKAGGAYVPLDPAYPGERLAYILSDAAPAMVLADATGRAALGDAALASRTVLDPNALPALPDTNPSVAKLTARHLAYVIYTSGSTGTPKGVMVEHRSVANLCAWHNRTFGVQSGCRSALTAGMAFDASAWELWPSLIGGGTLFIPSQAVCKEVPALLQWWQQQPLDVTFLVTPLAEMALADQRTPAELRYLLTGGECFPQLTQPLPAELTLVNQYGPTETTVVATSGQLSAEDTLPHIGRPIANTRIYLLDRYGQPVPLGAVGELYIGGAGVARGYLNRPELTAERFVPDPFSSEADARLYKTGDMARYLPDGNLVFLGRNDDQVKVRGFRIEPGEIEACLTAHPQVRDAVVLACGEGSDKRLVAYVQAEANEQLASTLRAHVAANLPEYMVPSAFVRLDAWPLTPNGKLDRRALPEPDADALAHQAYEAPQGELETTLAQIWSKLLGVEQVGRHDSFFALGGHSLLAVQLVLLVQKSFNVEISVRILFEAPSVAKLAERLESNALDATQTENAIETTQLMKSDAALTSDLTKQTLPGTSRSTWQQVLLTGATGFVGRYLLIELLRQTNAHIICLVKSNNEHEARSRILSALEEIGQSNLDQCRISVLCGNLAQAKLGLTETQLAGLADNLDAIIHNGAMVNHFFSYRELRQANVLATDTLVRVAATGREKSLHYISTLSVAPEKAPLPFTEDSDISMEPVPNGYVQSKWVAEHLINVAAAQGIPCGIHRLAHITADSTTGYCNTEDRVYRMIRAIARLGVAFDANELYLQTPVDHAAHAIVKLALHQKECRQVTHIMGHQSMELDKFISQMNNNGVEISDKKASLHTWLEKLKYMAEKTLDDNLMKLSSIADEILDSAHEVKSNIKEESNTWCAKKTSTELSKLNFRYPDLSESYIRLIIDFLANKYLKKEFDDKGYQIAKCQLE